MERNYEKLEIEKFGRILLESGDLDPVYIALYKCVNSGSLGTDHLSRWLLAYILCYHCGAASYFSERKGAAFWDALGTAAKNVTEAPVGGRWPRSHERRHWRGQFAVDVVNRLKERYQEKPENFIVYLTGGEQIKPEPIPFRWFSARVREHHGFGDWAAFKLADLVDRLGIVPVDFNYSDVVVYRDPVLSAEMVYRKRNGLPSNVKVKPQGVKEVFDYLIEYFQDYSAPPLHDRPIGVQEVETILCKWKSHRNGRYPIYNDIREIDSGLAEWIKVSETADLINKNMPSV